MPEATRQQRYSGTKDVADTLSFDVARLEAYLAGHIDGFTRPLEVRQFKGGQSNPTYQLITPNRKYVLRRKPPGKLLPSAHAVDREFRIISALHPTGFPVARPYLLCEDDGVIGTMFYVMECVEGRIFWDGALPDVARAERRAIYDAMNETLARLHGIDYPAIGLGDYGKAGNYIARQIARWSKQYQASETETIAEMDKLIAWLPGRVPQDERISIVHGDFRIDNLILHPSEPRVLAVLDWELSTIGDPLADFAYHLMQWQMPVLDALSAGSLLDQDLSALGIPDADEYIAAYCRRTGRESLPEMNYYAAYNFFRLAGILQGIVGRVRDGTAANANAARNAAAVRPLAERAWHFAKRAGAQD
ncbi:MAG: phosphotransferase family protein [Alphaproteobacteria bacterium]|nr:phosphotransferase family protein [Alphaproteobacteria bacterium]MDE2111193.1 phosphotransferase family protein [Alphaproteobacteria bacterium]MDE2496011.1 phosphotransferase family protein [Alphaproteobacteria bacterium]